MNAFCVAKIKDFRPDIIGLSATTAQMIDVEKFSRVLRQNFPDVLLVIGGSHATSLPEDTLMSCPNIDLAIVGEGELPLFAIAEQLAKKTHFFGGINGLAFRSGENVIVNGKADVVENLDELPFPARDLLPMDVYLRPSIERFFLNRMTSVITSRGCPFSCDFCTGSLTKKVRYHSPEYVIKEVLSVVDTYKVEVLYFADDFFLAEYERALKICRGFIDSGISRRVKWIAQLRPSLIQKNEKTHLEVLRLMKNAGCVHVEYGFESGSQEELMRMNKRADASEYTKIVFLAKQAGLCAYANIIVGYIDETVADLDATLDFLKKTNVDKVQLSRFYPLPGTKAYKKLLERGYSLGWRESTLSGAFDKNFTQMSDEDLSSRLKNLALFVTRKNLCYFLLNYAMSHPLRLLQVAFEKIFVERRFDIVRSVFFRRIITKSKR
jgi:radical SAM superfamily enzyme YgiQ (UPF0313 family)